MQNFLLDEDSIIAQAHRDGITHISTGVAAVRYGKILLVRRTANDYLGGVYELPGGGVDEGETIIQGALREVREETGLVPTKIVATFAGFDYSTDKKPHVRQINFLVEVAPGDVILNPAEHDEYIWVDQNNANTIDMTESMRACVADVLQAVAQR